ncbi:alpha-N-arabinofuranosidase [Arachidicoccus rhizosphaerae]|uniref:non-reducing end alpha-L-arabinofuranosidase n=1 Tax=Arachidicoccus rhizosphaerae TaxID=551991 RepID=A0A1H3ZSC2_9BACT|nr:alpha-L-arabinofuranosidase C-terminal domain-containing protein [Arachidicoccus rhizosphaerae]SEA26607.1 alpha-N-arabinofuranosidase [Arachidicoccus rhizosphaerae]
MKKQLLTILMGCLVLGASAQKAVVSLDASQAKTEIDPNIYGMFSEHLGRGIYGGIWVPKDAKVKKEGRIRMDVVEALRKIQIPNLRWPGGCFADEYHWMDGIGDPAQRPKMINTNWGGVTEDNSFGTNEFMQLCHLLHTQPYISGNMGSGTVQEMSNWVEYLNFDGESPMTKLRKQDGVDKPYGVQFFGIGNESWGCGGNMTPEYYVDQFRRYATFARSYQNAPLKRIASGANSDDYHWTEVLMKGIPLGMMWGISLHYYTIPTGSWGKKGSATDFTEAEYFNTMKNCLHMEDLVTKHSAIMDKYDPQKKVALVVDEWGVWTDAEPGTNPSFLYQQNSMRDALIAATTLNIFNNHADRVKMANLAQTVNVLQSLILTKGDEMILTPTYYVFEMYKKHQGGKLVPLHLISPAYTVDGKSIDAINGSASIDKAGVMHISLVNLDAEKARTVTVDLTNTKYGKVSGELLDAKTVTAINTFEQPGNVKTTGFADYKLSGSPENQILTVNLPAHSVVMLDAQ